MDKPNRHQYLIKVAYVGRDFYGVQPQKGLPTVGGTVENYLENLAGEPPRALCFSARTDRGVHAHESVATCWFRKPINLSFKPEKNPHLLIKSIVPVHFKVHARGISSSKTYRYVVETGCTPEHCLEQNNPFAWQIAPHMNRDSLLQTAAVLTGSHDFSSFRASGCQAGTTVKHMHAIKIVGPIALPDGRAQWHFIFKADAYLRKMIRNLMGLFVEVGTGLRPPSEAKSILEAKNRQKAGMCVPPHGLHLAQINGA